MRDVQPGEAKDPVSGHRQVTISVAVSLERSPRPVARMTVDLHDEAVFTPEEIDHVVEQRHVHLRLGNSVLAAERQESLLERAARHSRPERMPSQYSPETPSSGMAAVAAQQLDQVVDRDKPQAISFVDGTLEGSGVEHHRQIENRSSRCGT